MGVFVGLFVRTGLWESSVGVLRGRQRVDLPPNDDDTLITGVFRK